MDYKKIILLTLLSTPVLLFGQKQLEHEKRIYRSPEGKLYINKALPVYLNISTSPDEEAKNYRLKSEDSKEYTNPMYFDTEGVNTIRSPWKIDPETKEYVYPKEEVVFEIYADSKPPKTEISFKTKDLFKSEDKIYLGKTTKLDFEKSDAISGVNEVYYSLDGKPYKKFSEPLPFKEEKEYKLKYYSVDNVGNVEEPKEATIVLDLTAPETSLKIEGDKHKNIISGRSEINLQPNDKISQVKYTYYKIDDGNKRTYKGALKAKYLSEGEHKISYYSVDRVDNEEETKSFDFYVDKTPPRVVDELIGNTYVAQGKEYLSGRNRLKLMSMDNKAGVKEIRYSINDGSFKVYDKPFRLSSSGNLKIQTLAIDNVNNKKRTERLSNRSNRSHVDLSGPNLSHNFDGPSFVSKDTTYISKGTKIRLAGSDNQAGFKKITYSINNEGTSKNYEKPFSINEEGIYKISYTGFDNLDNTNTKQFLCIVDNSGPKLYHRFSIDTDKKKVIDDNSLPVYPEHVVLFLSSTDYYVGLDKMYYSLNDSDMRLYKTMIEGFRQETLYKLDIVAYDKLGNKSQKTTKFYID
jgi:hypothetical protein